MSQAPRVEMEILDSRLLGWGFPHYGSADAAGLDLHACLDGPITLDPGAPPVLIPCGFAMRIGDPGWCGVVAPRSGLGHRGLALGNTVGIIDADYEGPITLSAWNRNRPGEDPEAATLVIAPGDRIAQFVLVRTVRPLIAIVPRLAALSGRGRGGFGSTGQSAGADPGADLPA